MLASAPAVPEFAPEPGASMLYTSGTTGNPKGVHHRPAPIRLPNIAGYVPGDANLCTGPLYHAAPLEHFADRRDLARGHRRAHG